MKCPVCNKEISEKEYVCPYCSASTDTSVDFNNYKEDGFVRLQQTNETNGTTYLKQKNDKPQYLKLSDVNIFFIALIFVLIIAIITIFGLRGLTNTANKNADMTNTAINSTEAPTTPATENTVQEFGIENIYGVWKNDNDVAKDNCYIPFYTFSENSLIIEYGAIDVTSTVIDFSTEKEHKIFISTNNFFCGTFTFNLVGNEADGYTLILTNEKTKKTQTLTKVDSAIVKEVVPPKEFTIDEKLIGKWYNVDNMTYEFKENGTFSRYNDGQYLEGTWTISEENTIQVTFTESMETSRIIEYKIKNNTLIITNDVYTKE